MFLNFASFRLGYLQVLPKRSVSLEMQEDVPGKEQTQTDTQKKKKKKKVLAEMIAAAFCFLTFPDGRAPYQHFAHTSQPLPPVPGPCVRVIRPAQQLIPNCSNLRAPQGAGDRPPQRLCSSPGPPRFP